MLLCLIIYVICAFIAYGILFAHYDSSSYCITRKLSLEDKRDLAFMGCLLGPLSLWTVLYHYEWKIRYFEKNK